MKHRETGEKAEREFAPRTFFLNKTTVNVPLSLFVGVCGAAGAVTLFRMDLPDSTFLSLGTLWGGILCGVAAAAALAHVLTTPRSGSVSFGRDSMVFCKTTIAEKRQEIRYEDIADVLYLYNIPSVNVYRGSSKTVQCSYRDALSRENPRLDTPQADLRCRLKVRDAADLTIRRHWFHERSDFNAMLKLLDERRGHASARH